MEAEASEHEASGLREETKPMEDAKYEDDKEEYAQDAWEESKSVRIPLHRWVMHGSVMFGREFCYAMETALVTPVLLQIGSAQYSDPSLIAANQFTGYCTVPITLAFICCFEATGLYFCSNMNGVDKKRLRRGLPEQYYSLVWFLSPIFGLLFTPVIGSASDRCTLRWGRRRPFILALCVGVLLGVALFLNGSLIGLSIGDKPNSQPIGIVLTVLGVVVLDFCADASEGPIRAYLLDVADTEEQDLALNIYAFSAGLGGATGYMLGGLDWTGTALGRAFKAQEQVLFLFASIIFIISVILHMFSIPEQPFVPTQHLKSGAAGDSDSLSSSRPVSLEAPRLLEEIPEEDALAPSRDSNEFEPGPDGMDFLAVERVRSKSDSVLAMPDATIELDSDLDPDAQHFWPVAQLTPLDAQGDLENAFTAVDQNTSSLSPPGGPIDLINGSETSRAPTVPKLKDLPSIISDSESSHLRMQTKVTNGVTAGPSSPEHTTAIRDHSPSKLANRSNAPVSPRTHPHTFYRQPSFTFSYYVRVRTQRQRLRHSAPSSPPPITTSRSLNDLSDLQGRADRRELQLSTSSLSSEGSSSVEGSTMGTRVRLLWLSMLKMPRQLWRLCVCHLVTWFSILAEAVFYTDFMGQVIYHGEPKAPVNSTELQNYNKGVQMGCWGLVVYAATAAAGSAILQKYLDNFDLSIKVIYIVGTLSFSVGTAVMAIFPNVYVAMVTISTMGIISMSISYCPYALLGSYHELKEYTQHSPENTRRGFGIDCAILTCQVYISQIMVASALGAVVEAVGSVRVIPVVASVGSFLGFLTACFLVIYPDVDPGNPDEDQRAMGLSAESEEHRERSNQRLALLDLADGDNLKNTEKPSIA